VAKAPDGVHRTSDQEGTTAPHESEAGGRIPENVIGLAAGLLNLKSYPPIERHHRDGRDSKAGCDRSITSDKQWRSDFRARAIHRLRR
jgi:hypothetical protein